MKPLTFVAIVAGIYYLTRPHADRALGVSGRRVSGRRARVSGAAKSVVRVFAPMSSYDFESLVDEFRNTAWSCVPHGDDGQSYDCTSRDDATVVELTRDFDETRASLLKVGPKGEDLVWRFVGWAVARHTDMH